MMATTGRRAAELRSTAAKLLRLASEIEADEGVVVLADERRRGGKDAAWSELNTQLVLASAVDSYRHRRRRTKFIDPDLFGEPAWDMLLDLFAARLQNRSISVSSACIAASVPSTTALRWLGVLENAGLVERYDNDTDMRVTWVRLTKSATQTMREYFEDIIGGSSRIEHDLTEYLILTRKEEV